MTILAACHALRRDPFALVSETSAAALHGFFAGYGMANAGVRAVLAKIAVRHPGTAEMNACVRIYLAAPDPRASFDQLLDAIEQELGGGPEPPAIDARFAAPLLDEIERFVAQGHTGLVPGSCSWSPRSPACTTR
jgi:hypothetical protein